MLGVFGGISSVIHLALFVTGLVLVLTLRRGDPRAALLAAIGFGCEIVSLIAWAAGAMVVNAVFRFDALDTFRLANLGVTLIGRLFEIAGLVLVFTALLRRFRAARAEAAATAVGVRY